VSHKTRIFSCIN